MQVFIEMDKYLQKMQVFVEMDKYLQKMQVFIEMDKYLHRVCGQIAGNKIRTMSKDEIVRSASSFVTCYLLFVIWNGIIVPEKQHEPIQDSYLRGTAG
jgi:hypothetical protein